MALLLADKEQETMEMPSGLFADEEGDSLLSLHWWICCTRIGVFIDYFICFDQIKHFSRDDLHFNWQMLKHDACSFLD